MKEIELEIPVTEMEEGDLRTTFSEVMEAHEQNLAEFSELKKELDALKEQVEDAEATAEDLATAKAYFAEKGEVVTGIDAELLVERFSMDELTQFAQKFDEAHAEEAEASESEFSEDEHSEETGASEGESEAEPEAEPESIFAERPSKTPAFSADDFDARREAAKQRLQGLGGISLE